MKQCSSEERRVTHVSRDEQVRASPLLLTFRCVIVGPGLKLGWARERSLVMSASFFSRTLLVAMLALAFPVASFAHWDVGISVSVAPPLLPVYVQPPCPSPGYIWTPGYWAYSDD